MSHTMIRTVVSNLSVASHSPFETSWSCSIYTFYGNIDHPVINTWSLMKNWWQFNTFKVIFRLTNARSVLMIQGNNLKCRFPKSFSSECLWYNVFMLEESPISYICKNPDCFFFFFLLGHSWTAAAVLEHVSKRTWIITQSICSWICLCTINTHTGHQCRWYSHRYYINQSNAAAEKHFHTSNWLLEKSKPHFFG